MFFLSLPSTSLLVPWPLSIPAVFLQTSVLGPVSLLCFLASPELQILKFKCFQNFSTWTPHRLLRVNIQSSLSTLHCSRYPETTITSEISANKQHLASPQGFPISANGTPLATHLLPQLEIWSHPLFSLTPNPLILCPNIYLISSIYSHTSTKPTQICYYNNLNLILTFFPLIHILYCSLSYFFKL